MNNTRVTTRSLIIKSLFLNLFRLHLTVTDVNGEVIDGTKIEGMIAHLLKSLKGQHVRDLDSETVVVLTSFGKKDGHAVESKQLEGHNFNNSIITELLRVPQISISQVSERSNYKKFDHQKLVPKPLKATFNCHRCEWGTHLPKRLNGQHIRDLDSETVVVLTSFGRKDGHAVESKQLEGHNFNNSAWINSCNIIH
uniref:Uncharacterized protein n=1 Tax=Salix viminalis TaxID=40686 RepID=A0A6N2K079_SALVM